MKRLSSNRGVALMLVLVSLLLLSVLSYEILITAQVDLRIGRNARDRLQAYYLALSSARFSMLRLYMYKEVKNLTQQVSASAAAAGAPAGASPISPELVDKIWSQVLPRFPLPGMKVDWPGTVASDINSEGSKIPINLLDRLQHRSSSEAIGKDVEAQLAGLIKGLKEDEEFDKLYRDLQPEDLIDPLKDWIDPDSIKSARGAGDETNDYDRLDPPYFPRNDRMPTLSELHMISGWNADLENRLSKFLSVLNLEGTINPNYVPLARIKAVAPKLTDEELREIEKHRQETPFKDLNDLANFVQTSPNIKNGRDFQLPPEWKPRLREDVFVINASALVGEAQRGFRIGVRIPSEEPATSTTTSTPGSGASTGGGASSGTGGTPATTPSTKLLDPQVVTFEETT